jgi:hypothetical protein
MKYQLMRENGIATWSHFERDVVEGIANRIVSAHAGLDWFKVRVMVAAIFHADN